MNADREHAQQLELDSLSRKMANAPLDDEPFTEEDRQAVAEADEWLKHNKPIPLEDVLSVRPDNGRLGHDGQDPTARGKPRGEWLRALPSPIRPNPTFATFRSPSLCICYGDSIKILRVRLKMITADRF